MYKLIIEVHIQMMKLRQLLWLQIKYHQAQNRIEETTHFQLEEVTEDVVLK